MGIFSALNPLTFGRKQAAAWNALMGAYTFSRLNKEHQERVLEAADHVARRDFRQPFAEITQKHGPFVRYNLVVYAMRELSIRPAVGKGLWFSVANPFVASIGAEEVVGFVQRQLEKEHGIQFPDLANVQK